MKYNLFCAQVYQNEDGKKRKKNSENGVFIALQKKEKGEKKNTQNLIYKQSTSPETTPTKALI